MLIANFLFLYLLFLLVLVFLFCRRLKPVEAGVPGASVALGGGGSPAPINK
jgi:hypothetical protein